ncbi:disease resistance protein RGA2-like [Phragmites australis]|uniref:disease resistance protein RGA2-like n=1 Tax=Phragmites australis TaxID=29695 RepID=UPI002D77C9E0|nr:disease resistance protein RGA2-like [Phragmites australis]XP_062194549.1 disease resistance protein RGA2-like [Phragmites australis]
MDPGIVVSTIGVFVQVIFDKYLSSKLEQWAARANLGGEFQNLRGHLEMAKAILETLKGSAAMEKGICQLAQELKSSAYDAEDVLDELDYLHHMEMVEDRSQNKVATSSGLSFPPALQRVFHQPGAIALPPFKRARQIVNCVSYDLDSISSKMKSIADRLQRITAHTVRVAQLKKLVAFDYQQPKPPNSRQTSSLLTEPEVYGRDEEKNAIIKMLLEPNRTSMYKSFSVLPVVGIGGVGKTTLVQYVYNDPTIMNSFEVRAWACASDFLDVKQVTIDILQSIDEEGYHQLISSRSLDNIQTTLLKKLGNRKFLIVLDDVWCCSNWELMCAPFSSGMPGSKIILTTRHQDIANSVGTIPSVTLRGLEDGPFWSLFKQNAFGDDDIFYNLTSIGRKIANRLNGIPLAAKTIGKLLHKQHTTGHWMSILDSNLWELRQRPQDIIPVLLLSYQHLSTNVQRCFAFCSAFPKDHSFSEEELIFSWMAHGFIQSMRGDKTPEDIAREYLYELASASFFEVSENDNLYRMHGLLHDLACSVAQDECFATNDNFSRGIPNTVRHLYLLYPDQAKNFCLNFSLVEPRSPSHGELLEKRLPGGFVELKNLRSIWFRNASTIALSDDGFWKMPINYRRIVNLRILCLHHINSEALLVTVGDLIHLRYLDLRFSDISELPESLCKLYHLQVLDIRSCKNLVKLPMGINNLISLRHLLVDDSSKFLAGYAGIPYIGKLASLQELDLFNVSKEEAFNIEQLKELREMGQSLSIGHLENVASKEEASNSGLKEKYRLNELTLSWSSNLEDRASDAVINILEGLEPHPNLKHLRITRYSGTISPTWLANDLNIKYLESLYLQDCSGWEVLPPLGKLPYLRKLHSIGMKAIRCIGSEFYGSGSFMGFPCLEELYFAKMPKWHSWCGVEKTCCFPNLLTLTITDCTSLQLIPVEQWSEQVCYVWFPRLRTLDIENCPRLAQLPPLPHAPTLSRISLKNAGTISSMELNGDDFVICGISDLKMQRQYSLQFHNLRNLKSFSISSCDNFVVLPWKGQGKSATSEVSITMPDAGCSLSSINELKICGSGVSEDILHEILTNSGILDCLSIKYCPQITTLELHPMTRLDYLVIEDCLELRSLKCMQTLIHLRELTVLRSPKFIEGWKNLVQLTEGSPQEIAASLKRLHIDDSSFLTMPICRTLGYLQYLMIDSDQQIMSLTQDQEQAFSKLTSLRTLAFNECPNLRALPARLHQISSLKRLDISSCESINSLPHQGLPGSLERLFIVGCSLLREKCIDGGIDQNKIVHIREIIL